MDIAGPAHHDRLRSGVRLVVIGGHGDRHRFEPSFSCLGVLRPGPADDDVEELHHLAAEAARVLAGAADGVPAREPSDASLVG